MKAKTLHPRRLLAAVLVLCLLLLLWVPASAASLRLTGDLDGNGSVDGADMTVLRRALLGVSEAYAEEALDLNLDGTVDIRDLVALQAMVSGDGKTDGILTVQSVTLSGTTATLTVTNTSTVWETDAASYVALTCLDGAGMPIGTVQAKLGVLAPGATKTVQCTAVSGSAAVKAAGIAADYWSIL